MTTGETASVDPSPPRHAVLWQETAEAPAVIDAEVPERVDVAVVGGGYCGLAAAATAAAAGASVAVLEAGALGSGASTRNGGMVIPELKAGPLTLARTHGELGVRMQADVDAAFAWVEDLIGAEGIDCAYARTGQLYLAHTRSKVPGLHRLAEEHRALGHPARVVAGADLAAEIGSSRFPAGLVLDRTGGLHPARFHAGLVERAGRAGATLHPHHRVTVLARHGDGHELVVGRERVRAGQVLLATNAYADGLVPWLRRRVLPMGSFIVATAPLAPELADEVLPTRRMCVDTKELLWYWRLDQDRRMVFGGRRRLGRVTLDDAAEFLRRSMVEVHPALAEVPVERVWGGDVALTLDRLPHVGQVGGAWYATGCNGSGVALNTWLGHRMGEVLVGAAEPPSFAALRHPAVPLHRLRHAYLPVVSRWFEHADRHP